MRQERPAAPLRTAPTERLLPMSGGWREINGAGKSPRVVMMALKKPSKSWHARVDRCKKRL